MRNIKLRYYLRALGLGIVVTALILGVAGSKETKMTDAQIRERALELGMVDSDAVVLSDLQRPDFVPSQTLQDEGQEIPEETVEETVEEAIGEDMAETTEETAEVTMAETAEETAEVTMAETAEGTAEETMEEATEEIAETTMEEVTEEIVEEAMEESTEETVEETIGEATEETVEQLPEEIVEEYVENKEPETVTLTIRSGASSDSVSRQLVELGLIEDAGAYDRYLCDNGYSKTICVGNFEIPLGATEEEIAKIITGKR